MMELLCRLRMQHALRPILSPCYLSKMVVPQSIGQLLTFVSCTGHSTFPTDHRHHHPENVHLCSTQISRIPTVRVFVSLNLQPICARLHHLRAAIHVDDRWIATATELPH